MASVSISHPSSGETFFKRSAADPLTVVVDGGINAIWQGPVNSSFEVDSIAVTVGGVQQPATFTDPGHTYRASVPIGSVLGALAVHVRVQAHIHHPSNGHFPDWDEQVGDLIADSGITVAADSAPPAVSLWGVAFPDGTYPTATVDFTVSDLSGLRSVSWRVGGGAEAGAQDRGGSNWHVERADLRTLTGRTPTQAVASPLTMNVRAVDRAIPTGNEQTLAISLADGVAPSVALASPNPGQLFANSGGGATVTLAGRVEDHWTGVAAIQYSVDGGPWADIAFTALDVTTVDWSINHHLADAGEHTLAVRARDGAGNVSAPVSLIVEVARFLDVSTGDPLGQPAYLRDLMEFAVRSVTFPHTAAEPIRPGSMFRLLGSEVSRIFHQPMLALLEPGLEGAAVAPVTELRPIVETLRRVLDPAQQDLVAHWQLADGAGPVALDATGNGFAGRIEAPVWTEGRDGPALGFDGNTEVVLTAEMSAALSMETTVTIAAWVWPEMGSDQTILMKDNAYMVGLDPAGTVRFAFSTTSPWAWTSTGTTLAPDEWSHVAVAFDRGWSRPTSTVVSSTAHPPQDPCAPRARTMYGSAHGPAGSASTAACRTCGSTAGGSGPRSSRVWPV